MKAIAKEPAGMAITEPTDEHATPAEPTDEAGIPIIDGSMETWMFVKTQFDFYCTFRRLVNISGTRHAEVDYASYGGCNTPRLKRYVRTDLDFRVLEKCQPGDLLHCRWLLDKPYVFADQQHTRYRKLTAREWDDLAVTNGTRYKRDLPSDYNRLVE